MKTWNQFEASMRGVPTPKGKDRHRWLSNKYRKAHGCPTRPRTAAPARKKRTYK